MTESSTKALFSAMPDGRLPDGSMLRPGHYLLLIAGSPQGVSAGFLRALAAGATYALACDGGANLAYAAGLSLDYLVGDFDSIEDEVLAAYRTCVQELISADSHKDETDLELALALIESEPHLRTLPLVVTNVLGGRVDHELAAIGAIIHKAHLVPVICEDKVTVVFLGDTRPELRLADAGAQPGTLISVVSLDGEALVTEKGLEWELDHYYLRPLDPRGVSNSMKSQDASVFVHEGTVAVFIHLKVAG